MTLPEHLVLFLKKLFLSDPLEETPKANRIMKSIGQDCVYGVSNGNIIPAKHILLPWGVKSLTGNVELIKVLNRMGHSISYSKLEELDTALCLQKQTQGAKKEAILLSTCHPSVPTSLAFDNIDHLEETLSGGGTSHRVNGIIIQPQVTTVNLPPSEELVTAMKTRSIKPVSLAIPEYNAGKREGPPSTTPLEMNHDTEQKSAEKKNFIWLFSRVVDVQRTNW